MRLLTRNGARRPAHAEIRDPEHATVFDEHGAVHSIQAAELTLPEAALQAIWSPMHLERLARTYWKYLSRVTLGLIRVVYTPTERAVVLIGRPFVLLRFRAPEYEMDDRRGVVRWRIRSGILVASEGHEGDGYLEIEIRRLPGEGRLYIEVEIASFYPAIAFRIARWLYANTQSRIHVLVTHGFLRSLSKLELEESAVGRFDPDAEPVNVGDTPWRVVGVLAGVAAVFAALLLSRLRSR
jgi:hypothetical protein